MDKIKLLTFIVIALLLVNIGTLGFLLAGRNHRHEEKREGPKRLIIEKLHFNKTQQQHYENLIRWHRGQIDTLDMKIHETKNNLYLLLTATEVNPIKKDSLIDQIAAYQKQIEKTHFKHFEDIKKLCKPEQLSDYKNLTEELANLFSRKPHQQKHD